MKKDLKLMMKNKGMFILIFIIFLLLTFGTFYLFYVVSLLNNIENNIRFLLNIILLFLWFMMFNMSINVLKKNKKKKSCFIFSKSSSFAQIKKVLRFVSHKWEMVLERMEYGVRNEGKWCQKFFFTVNRTYFWC